MVSITPTLLQNTGSPLCALSGLLLCQYTSPGLFSAVYVIKHTLLSSCPSQGPADVISLAAVYSYVQNILFQIANPNLIYIKVVVEMVRDWLGVKGWRAGVSVKYSRGESHVFTLDREPLGGM